MCARRRSPFLCLAKERNQRKATPLAVSLRFAAGNLRCSRPGCRRRTHYALRAPFKQPRRVSSRSACMLRCTRAPRPLRFSARPEGSGKTTRAIAALGPVHAARSARALGAERSDGPLGFHHPSARAEEHRAWGGRMQRSMHALRELTHCGCLNAAPQARSEFRNAAPRPSTAGCPVAERRGHAKWGRLSLLTFFGEAKKVSRPPGRTPGQRRIQKTKINLAPLLLTPRCGITPRTEKRAPSRFRCNQAMPCAPHAHRFATFEPGEPR